MEVTKHIDSNNDCVTDFQARGADRVWLEYVGQDIIVNIGPERLKFFASVQGNVMVKDGV